jgi:thiamine biosynthesis protein ThiI
MVRGLVLNSGGIDSPVAAYLMAKCDLVAIHFNNEPYTDDTTRIAELIVEKLEEVLGKNVPTITVPHGLILSTFLASCKDEDRKYICIFCRRMMFRIAERIAHMKNCNFLLTGENLGQVASQTLQNIYVTSKAVKIPIVRPVIGLDKLDIIAIAEKIGTYDISIENKTRCDAVPRYPVIKAQLERIEAIESLIDIETAIQEALRNVK